MEDGNLCYVTNSECTGENKIEVQTEGNTLTAGKISISNGEIIASKIDEEINVDGSIKVSAKLTKNYDEGAVYVDIYFDEFIGDASVNALVAQLYYNTSKLTYSDYFYGDISVMNDYTVGGDASKGKKVTLTILNSNQVGTGKYIQYKFTTDNLDSITSSDFTYNIKVSTKEHLNVPVQQNSTSEITILNNISDEDNYFVAKKSSSYDYAPGDINNDGYIDNIDVPYLRQYLLGKETKACKAMDVTGDGEIALKDLIRLKKYFIGTGTLEYSTMTDVPGHL